jgi:hypothetical protein
MKNFESGFRKQGGIFNVLDKIRGLRYSTFSLVGLMAGHLCFKVDL